MNLNMLDDEILFDNNCFLCSLHKEAIIKKTRPSTTEKTRFLFIFNSPNSEESKRNKIGDSYRGKVLYKILGDINIDIKEVRLTSLVRCHSNNIEIFNYRVCRNFTIKEVLSCNPDYIVCFGVDVYNNLFCEEKKISDIQGRILEKELEGVKVKVLSTVNLDSIFKGDKKNHTIITKDLSKLNDKYENIKFKTKVLVGDEVIDFTDDVLKKFGNNIIDCIAFDIETSSFDPYDKESFIIGVSVSMDKKNGYYIPFSHKDFPVNKKIQEYILKLPNQIPVICHNAKFDITFLKEKFNIHPKLHFDTYLSSYLCFGELHDHDLKTLSNLYLGSAGYEDELTEYKVKNKISSYSEIPFSIISKYAAFDAVCTYGMFLILKDKIKEFDMDYINSMMFYLEDIIIEIERKGANIDLSELKRLTLKYEEHTNKLVDRIKNHNFTLIYLSGIYKELYDFSEEFETTKNKKLSIKLEPVKFYHLIQETALSPKHIYNLLKDKVKDLDINLDSPIISSGILFHSVGLRSSVITKKKKEDSVTKESIDNLNTEILSKICKINVGSRFNSLEDVFNFIKSNFNGLEGLELHQKIYEEYGDKFCFYYLHLELIRDFMRYRSNKKLLSTYFNALPTYTHNDSIIHCNFNLGKTATGRLSSTKPSLHTIPRGEEVKSIFTSRFENGFILNSDFSQLEVRVLASFLENRYNDKLLTDIYREKKDLHIFSASKLFNKDEKDVTKNERQIAKGLTFGVIYEQSPRSMAVKNNLSVVYAEKVFKDYFNLYPSIPVFIDEQHRIGTTEGYVRTPFGRRRYVPKFEGMSDKLVSKLDRQSTNSIVQSTGSDLTVDAIISISKTFLKLNLKSIVINTVHDSIVFDIYPSELFTVIEVVKFYMSENLNKKYSWLKCPIDCDIEIGHNWANGVSVIKQKNNFYIKGDIDDIEKFNQNYGKILKIDFLEKSEKYNAKINKI